jgi:hypothetical protein
MARDGLLLIINLSYDIINIMMELKEISKDDAYPLIYHNHYSKVMPRLTKHYLGVFDDRELVGVLTLGWGTQPRQTINKLFPGLGTESYYEIGKMCMLERMPRNSESQMLSRTFKWMKENTDKLFLYTWADGIVGKPGYVYQAANFLYGGFIWTDIYVGPDGEKIHPRSAKNLLKENAEFKGNSNKKIFWMTPDFMLHKGIQRIKGKQFRYIYPLSKKARKMLKKSTVSWSLNYPKERDLEWKDATRGGKSILLENCPDINLDIVNENTKNVNSYKNSANLENLLEF